MKTSIIVIGFVLIIATLSGCIFDNSETPTYYEILLENSDCDPLCKEEYIVLSNGFIMKKYSIEKEIIKNEIEIVKIDESKAKEAITFVQGLSIDPRENRCIECDEYTLLTIKNKAAFMFADTEQNTPNDIKQIFEDSKQLFSTGVKQEDFFIQFVYKKIGQNSIDYHIFSNGSVLFEEFDDNINLTNVRVYDIGKEKIEFLKNIIEPGFFESESSIRNCYTIGLDHGYIEVKKENSYAFVWTCGAENSSADKLFNTLMKEFG